MQSLYDIPLKSWDGNENMLEAYKGKVTLVINVTTNCGNAPEYRLIETIYKKYKDQGFEVLAIPANEYCGDAIVYDSFINGLTCANDARDYAINKHKVTYNFSDLVYSNPIPPADQDIMDKYYPNRNEVFPRQIPENQTPHPLYQALHEIIKNKQGVYKCTCFELEKYKVDGFCLHGDYMGGNFEKYLIDRDGKFVAHYINGSLMPRKGEEEYAKKMMTIYVDENDLSKRYLKEDFDNSMLIYGRILYGEEEYNRLCSDIERLL
jgi:glutathione peroxidase-family protein